jgi:hypothetical protein
MPIPTDNPRLIHSDYRAIADWVVETCLRFGATVPTSYQVAGLFVQGLARATGQ